MRLAIIDADSLMWVTAYMNKDNKQVDFKGLDGSIIELVKTSKCDYYIGFIGVSGTPTFRNNIDPLYKANRPATPDFMKLHREAIENHLRTVYGFSFIEGVEVDDICATLHLQRWVRNVTENSRPYIKEELNVGYEEEDVETVLCSPDKDLKQVPGERYDYKKKITEIISEGEAQFSLWKQVMMGDSTDNIKGIPGTGEKKADKALGPLPTEEFPSAVLRFYLDYYKDQEEGMNEFMKNYRLIKLRTDLNKDNKLPLPTPKAI